MRRRADVGCEWSSSGLFCQLFLRFQYCLFRVHQCRISCITVSENLSFFFFFPLTEASIRTVAFSVCIWFYSTEDSSLMLTRYWLQVLNKALKCKKKKNAHWRKVYGDTCRPCKHSNIHRAKGIACKHISCCHILATMSTVIGCCTAKAFLPNKNWQCYLTTWEKKKFNLKPRPVYLTSQNHRISQNSRGWKGPLWVI